MDAREPRAPYGVLAGLQIAGGVAILAFGIFGAPASEKPADLIAGTLAILLGIISATVLPRLGEWAVIADLVASAILMGFLSALSETGQAQMGAGFGFVVVAMVAGTLLDSWRLPAFLAVLLIVLGLSYWINPAITNPLYLGVTAVVAIMVAVSMTLVVGRSRADAERYRVAAERLQATWDSQLDSFVLLDPVRGPDGAPFDLQIAEANAAASRRAGGVPLAGHTIREVFPGAPDEGLLARCFECLRSGEPVVLNAFPLTWGEEDPRLYDIRGFRAGTLLAMTWQDVTDRMRVQRDLDHRARFDDLTGVLNRGEGLRRLSLMLPARRSGERSPVVLFCDLDNFKEINDHYGHAMGDLVLRESARRLISCVRDGDLVIRAGGDEFVVVLMGVDSTDIGVTIAEKIRDSITAPILGQDAILSVTTSIGVAQAEPDQSVDELLALADQAMYRAKQSGRNRVALAGAEPVQGV